MKHSLHHVMFDVDGTLVVSNEFDGQCYCEAVYEVIGENLDTDWTKYKNVSDAGILDQHIRENGLDARRISIHKEVKEIFMNKVARHIINSKVQPVPGASGFINRLRRLETVSLSIATGGWLETALMKLESAEIDISGIPIASSNDHFSRSEIMKIARVKAVGENIIPCTYFGDAEWDKQACEDLGFKFVLVGKSTSHEPSILDFNNHNQAISFIDA